MYDHRLHVHGMNIRLRCLISLLYVLLILTTVGYHPSFISDNSGILICYFFSLYLTLLTVNTLL